MAIKRTDLREEEESRENEDQKAERESRESEAEAEAEQARQEELAAAREEAHKAQIDAATARGESEALKRGLTKPEAPVQWTDEQWEVEAAKYGTTGAALKAQVEISKAVAGHAMKPLQEEAAAARREAQEAREETNRLKTSKTRESAEAAFYKKNPALESHRDMVDDFMNSYPDADKIDAKTYEKRLSFAVDMVKGKVKETMRTRRPGDTGSNRLEVGEDERRRDEEENLDFDPRGTGNEGAATLMRGVMSNLGGRLRHEDSKEVWKKCRDEEDRGVSIGMDEDIALARQIQDRPLIGGRRGAR